MQRPERSPLGFLLAAALVLAVAAAAGGLWQHKQDRDARARAAALTGGDAQRGAQLMNRYGCAGCHHIPGVPNAEGRVGPSLRQFAGRAYIAGTLLNTPENLVRWIEDAPAHAPGTAMPRTGAAGQEARDIAAFLYTLG